LEYLSAAVEGKPIDGSDVTTFEEARAELIRLRRAALRVCDILNKTTDTSTSDKTANKGQKTAKKKKGHRQALAQNEDYKHYKKVAVAKSAGVRELLVAGMNKNLLFKDCSSRYLDDFADVFAPKKFSGGSTVIQQGEQGEAFYIVESGALDVFINVGSGEDKVETQVGVPYGPGTGFGELALLYNCPRAATIRASENCVLWEISSTAYKGLQLKQQQEAHSLKMASLRNVTIGKKTLGEILSIGDLESMALAVKTKSFPKGDVIIRQGEQGDVFYVITKGEVTVLKNKQKVASVGVNGFFGEKALLSSDSRAATCAAETDVECLTLLRDDFVLLLGNFEDILNDKRKSSVTSESFVEAELTTYAMSDLSKMGLLGEGAFGKVNLVKSKTDGRLFALKAQSKAFLVENGQESHTVGEFQLLRNVNHVFVVKIYQALQDKKFVYFLMNLLPGGELMDLLDSNQHFSEGWSRFYGASVISAFKAIHQQKIAYRDLKPENLVLDADGYCYVIDFGLAKQCENGKTWTFCGTPDYLAPEIVRGKGHDWGVDYWGFGVLLFELTYGYPPFYANNPTQTARKIIRGVYSTPSSFSSELSDLISKVLCDQSKRLGRTQGGADEIIKHQWFSGFDWDAMLEKTAEVPWKPEIGKLENLGKKGEREERVPSSDWNPVF
jgi:cGMP-dependent protein kinase